MECMCTFESNYGELANQWLSSIQLRVKESTYARYYYLVNAYILPLFGDHALYDISVPGVEAEMRKLLTQGRGGRGALSAKSVTDILSVMRMILEYGNDNGQTAVCNLKKILIRRTPVEIKVLNSEEQQRFRDYLLSDMDLPKAGTLLSLYTGIRIGELCALQWKNLNLENGILQIRQTMQRIQDVHATDNKKSKIIITDPKTFRSRRDIPLPSFVTGILQMYETETDAYFLTGRADKYMEPRTVQNHFKRYLKEAGIPDMNFHALRHTFATRCIEAGFEIKSLSEIMGHVNVNITMNRYVHSSFALKRENMNKLSF